MEGKSTFYIQSIDRALKIIDVIAEKEPDGIRLSAIAETLGLNIATTYRILRNLVEASYVAVKGDNAYILGPAFVRLGELAGSESNFTAYIHPLMEEAAGACGQTVYIAMLDVKDHTVVYMDKVAHRGTIQLSSGIGDHNYVHSTANGKILMSAYPDATVASILKRIGMPRLTEHTICSPEAYLKELRKVREDGYATDLEENEANVVCVAAPVFNAKGKIIASMSLSGIVGITMNGNRDEAIELVRTYAARLSEKMGYKK